MRKLILSVTTLLIITMTFTTVAYAWITIATVNHIEGLHLSASTADELKISIDGFNFSQTLDTQVLEDLMINQNLTDVTTLDGINFQTGGLRDQGIAYPNIDYLSFEIWFRTSKTQRNVYLVDNVTPNANYDTSMVGTYVVSKGVSWISNIDFQNGIENTDMVYTGEKHTYYAKDAIRIGFEELLDKPYDQRDEKELANFIFDPSNDPNMGYGKAYGAYDYFKKTSSKNLLLPINSPDTIYQLSQALEDNPYMANNNQSLITSLQPTGLYDSEGKQMYQSKVRINIWVEGWDANAFDAVLKDYIKIQLQFKSMSAFSL